MTRPDVNRSRRKLARRTTTACTPTNRPTARPASGGHPDWCARGQSCGLGEHRAQPVSLDSPDLGVVVLTRVLAATGVQHAEIRIRITLADGENESRAHLAHITAELEALLRRVILRR